MILLAGMNSSLPAFSQCDPDFDPFCADPDEEVPLDGGSGLLIGAGALYGLKKLREKRNGTVQKGKGNAELD